MKKTITRALLLMLTVASLGAVTSCKDYDEDRMNELESRINGLENAKLQDAIEAQKAQIENLESLYAQLQADLKDKVSCNCLNLNDAQKEALQALLNQLSNSQSKDLVITPENFADQFKDLMENDPNFKQIFNTYVTNVTTVACECGDLKKTIDELKVVADKNATDIVTLTKQYEDMSALLSQAQAAANSAMAAAEKAKAEAEAAAKKADDAYKLAQAALDKAEANGAANVEALQKEVDSLKTVTTNMNVDYTTIENNYTTLNQTVTTINEKLADLEQIKTDLQKAMSDASVAKSTAEKNKTEIEALWNAGFLTGKDTVNINLRLDTLANAIAKADTLIEKIAAEQAKQIEALEALTDKVDANATSIKEINDKIINELATKESVTALENKYIALKEEADKLRQDVVALAERLTNLEAKVDALAKLVTGITIQQVYNPAFGTVALPVGVNSNILLAYYGEANGMIEFPNADFIDIDPVYAAKAGALLVDDLENNCATAGKVYLTVNPSNVDFSGLNLDLVNSQDVPSPIKLSPLALSDKTLKFGFTRAGNHFYEAKATLAADDINAARLSIDKGAIANALKELIKTRSAAQAKVTAKDLAKVVFETAQDLSLDAEGVKATAEDGRTVTSEYAIAATAIKPLMFNSFDVLAEKQFDNIPGYTRATNIIKDFSNTLKSKIKFNFKDSTLGQKLANFQIDSLQIKDLTEDQLALFAISIDSTIIIDGMAYNLGMDIPVNVPVRFSKELSIPVTLNNVEVKVPVLIDKTVAVNIDDVNVTVPTIVVSTDNNGKPSSHLMVDVKDEKGNKVGSADVPLDQVNVDFKTDDKGNPTQITLAGKPVGNLHIDTTYVGNATVNDVVTYTLDINERVDTTINIQKYVMVGDYKYKRNSANQILDEKGGIYVPDNAEGLQPAIEYVGSGNGDLKTMHLVFRKDMRDAAVSLWGSAQSALGGVNKMLDDARSILDDVNDLINGSNNYEDKINDMVDSYVDRVISYLDKANNKATNGVNKVLRNLPRLLEPTVLLNSDKGLVIAGLESAMPQASGKVQLIATSYTGELICPMLAKVVTVNGVQQTIGEGGVINATNVKVGKNVVKFAALDYAGVERDYTFYFMYK